MNERELSVQWNAYRAYLVKVAPEITDADIERLWHFLPRLTPMAAALRRAYP